VHAQCPTHPIYVPTLPNNTSTYHILLSSLNKTVLLQKLPLCITHKQRIENLSETEKIDMQY